MVETRALRMVPLPPPRTLLDVIELQQRRHIRDSVSTDASDCFTDQDFSRFTALAVPAQIVRELWHNTEFKRLIVAIKLLTSSERQALLADARGNIGVRGASLEYALFQ